MATGWIKWSGCRWVEFNLASCMVGGCVGPWLAGVLRAVHCRAAAFPSLLLLPLLQGDALDPQQDACSTACDQLHALQRSQHAAATLLPLPLQGDALDPQEAWRGVLKGAAGVVSTLGAFGSHEHMYKVRFAGDVLVWRAIPLPAQGGVLRAALCPSGVLVASSLLA